MKTTVSEVRVNERWLPISGYEGIYEASDLGRIRSIPRERKFCDGRLRHFEGRILSPVRHSQGYASVRLSDGPIIRTHLVHRLVAAAFCSNPFSYDEVNHRDADKWNNASENLEWCSRAQNQVHAAALGLFASCGSQKGAAKLDEGSVSAIKRLIEAGKTNVEIARMYGVSTAPI